MISLVIYLAVKAAGVMECLFTGLFPGLFGIRCRFAVELECCRGSDVFLAFPVEPCDPGAFGQTGFYRLL